GGWGRELRTALRNALEGDPATAHRKLELAAPAVAHRLGRFDGERPGAEIAQPNGRAGLQIHPLDGLDGFRPAGLATFGFVSLGPKRGSHAGYFGRSGRKGQ